MDQQRVDKVLVERVAAGDTTAGNNGTAGEASA
jgi:hypothetical protein